MLSEVLVTDMLHTLYGTVLAWYVLWYHRRAGPMWYLIGTYVLHEWYFNVVLMEDYYTRMPTYTRMHTCAIHVFLKMKS